MAEPLGSVGRSDCSEDDKSDSLSDLCVGETGGEGSPGEPSEGSLFESMMEIVLNILGIATDELHNITDDFIKDIGVYRELSKTFEPKQIVAFRLSFLLPLLQVCILCTFFALWTSLIVLLIKNPQTKKKCNAIVVVDSQLSEYLDNMTEVTSHLQDLYQRLQKHQQQIELYCTVLSYVCIICAVYCQLEIDNIFDRVVVNELK